MSFKQWIKVIVLGGSLLTLAACSSMHKKNQADINDANAAYGSEAQASGVGEGANFGDQGPTGDQQLSKRVYYFNFDSSMLRDEDKPALAANANYLVAHSNVKILLEGHTDPRGSREYNIGLGERRAKAVATFLQSKGVNASQIRVLSYGAEKLAAPGHTESDYQLDRRVVVVYLK
ncbi:MAG: hypothetical protein A3E83_01380 [Gammaproteobacteria bacterium RIFCSPHIGHO2_12_FULL_41_20]|nr:MAG: hypothetical protein A3E83_01380 [Gammaproteobacteria bacterium RIFCSPHIGHO2_12_FULL_41_20]